MDGCCCVSFGSLPHDPPRVYRTPSGKHRWKRKQRQRRASPLRVVLRIVSKLATLVSGSRICYFCLQKFREADHTVKHRAFPGQQHPSTLGIDSHLLWITKRFQIKTSALVTSSAAPDRLYMGWTRESLRETGKGEGIPQRSLAIVWEAGRVSRSQRLMLSKNSSLEQSVTIIL